MGKLLLVILFISSSIFAQESYRLWINRIDIPLNNEGILADVTIDGEQGGKLDEKHFLFSAGFFLSGKNADTIWANAVASASRIQDYQPGNVDSVPFDPRYGIYVLEKSFSPPYEPFGLYWQKWKFAVELGADFYDGDLDGVYNPVDLNGNGQWDPNEDSPDMIGDITTWCVYNDGVADSLRRFLNKPLGIEIQQTVFAFFTNNNNYDARSSSFFVRYKIINTGKVSDVFDSVYFSGWADTDLGEPFDDIVGCDTLNNSGYIYNDGDDPDWGINPPAHFIKILQGPYSYISGETFIDNNSNGVYEEGIDTPLDTAYNYKGVTGIDTLPGAKNLSISSFTHYMASTPLELSDPNTSVEARNYLLGGVNKFGEPFNPCSWPFGIVLGGIPCNEINPHYMYSGDPVTQTGWINTLSTDQRQLTNAGPFKLEVGKPVNIIVAHIAGRGYDHLNSITRARSFSSSLDGFLKSNFTDIPVRVDDRIDDQLPSSFHMDQNFPNPFNPKTNIGFRISDYAFVSLKVYDVLGNEIVTIINEEKPAGTYELEFDASSLSSGIYFYELRTEKFSSVKKMILLK